MIRFKYLDTVVWLDGPAYFIKREGETNIFNNLEEALSGFATIAGVEVDRTIIVGYTDSAIADPTYRREMEIAGSFYISLMFGADFYTDLVDFREGDDDLVSVHEVIRNYISIILDRAYLFAYNMVHKRYEALLGYGFDDSAAHFE